MDNIHPVRMFRVLPSKYKTVEWKLHNTCNYDCSFCHISNKSGTEKWLPVSEYIGFAKILMRQAEEEGKFIWFQLTGGEPTLYPELSDLLDFIKQNGHKVVILTNGSRTPRYWQEISERGLIDILILTHHTEQTPDENKTLDVISLFHNTSTDVRINVTAPLDLFDEGVRRFNTFVERTGAIVTLKPILGAESSTQRALISYTTEQLAVISKSTSIKGRLYSERDFKPLSPEEHFGTKMSLELSDGQIQQVSVYDVVSKNINNFQGWQCSVGRDLITIQHESVYRAVCRMGGTMGAINDTDFKFSNTDVMCTATKCTCLMDLQEPRHKA